MDLLHEEEQKPNKRPQKAHLTGEFVAVL